MRLPALSVGVIALLVALAGCGGGESDATGDFVAAADAICVEQAQAELDSYDDNVGPDGSTAGYLKALRLSRKQQLDDLEALQAPADAADAFAAYTKVLAESLTALDDAITAVEGSDDGAFDEARQRTRALRDESNAQASAAGLEACAGALSDASVAGITETMDLSIDSSVAKDFCTERTTEAFITVRFEGDVASCVREQRSGDNGERVDLEGFFGVDDLYANGIATIGAGNRYEVSLAYEDDVWKLNTVGEAP